MLEKSIVKTIFKYSLPNMISMWVFTLYTMVDGIFVSKFVGKLGLAGINLTFPLINLIFSISIMIAVGSSTLISIKFGENNYEEGNKLLSLASLINLLLGFLLTVLILLNLEKVINILGATKTEDVYPYVKDYLSNIILFSVFYMSGYAFEIFIKIDGSPSYPLICVLIGGCTNLFLDYLLVVVFPYGVKGAAIATGLSQVITCSLLLFYIKFKAKYVKFFKFEKKYLEKIYFIFRLGFSEFITEISSGLLILIYNLVILSKLGVFAVSIFGAISYITSFIVMTMIGFSQGIQPVISYNLGRKDYKNLRIIFRVSISTLSLMGLFFFVVINYFSNDIAKLFFKESSLIKEVKNVLNIYSFYYLVLGINLFISSYFTAIKKVFYSALITFPRGILFNSLFLLILPDKLGENGIWISPFLSEVLTVFISFYLLLRIKKYKNS